VVHKGDGSIRQFRKSDCGLYFVDISANATVIGNIL